MLAKVAALLLIVFLQDNFISGSQRETGDQPHLILILADDLGESKVN